jgi:PAS domain S-box-containing protein
MPGHRHLAGEVQGEGQCRLPKRRDAPLVAKACIPPPCLAGYFCPYWTGSMPAVAKLDLFQLRSDSMGRKGRGVARVVVSSSPVVNKEASARARTGPLDTAGPRESELDLRAVIDGIPGFVAILAPDGYIDVINRQLLEYCGGTLDDLRQWGTNGTIHEDDLAKAAVFANAVASGMPYEIEQRLRRFDGVYRWFANRGVPARDASGRITHWYVLLTDIDDRKRAEAALSESERNLKLIIDTTPALIWSARPDGVTESVNQHFIDYLGRPWQELETEGWGNAIHPEDRAPLVALWDGLRESGMAGQAEARLQRHDGEYRWFLLRVNPLHDEDGNIVKWYGVNVDIEDRKCAEDAVAASEHNLRQAISTIPAFVFCNNADGPNEFLNRRWHDYTGISPEQASGRGWMKSLHPDDLPDMMHAWLTMLHEGQGGEVEGRMRRFDGVYRWFSFRTDALRDETGKILKWYGTITDTEDRRRADVELRQAYDRLNEAQRLSKTGSFITDLVADDHNWSDEAYRIFDFDADAKVTVEMIREVVHPDDLAYFDAVIERGVSGTDVDFNFRAVTRRGALKHVRGIARVIERVAGRPLFIGALQDVTEMRLAEEALNRSRAELAHVSRAAAMSALTASIAHEVNQPLAGIITNAGTCLRMLSSDPPNIEGARETARRTIRDGNRASEVIARLRGMFGKKEFTAEAFDLNEATREVIALSQHELQRRRVFLLTEFRENSLRVTGDRVQLQQVILNLLLNAADAMKNVDDRSRQIVVRLARGEAASAMLSVHDKGVGIAPEAFNKLFDAFYTTKPDGMGIGLSVSRSIIERHQGRIWASRNDGHGATFSFSIPCA